MKIFKKNISKLLTIVVISTVLFTPTGIIVNATSTGEMHQIEQKISIIEKYFISDENGTVTYMRDVAIEDGLSNDLLSFADNVYAFGLSQSTGSEKVIIKDSRDNIAEVNAKAVAFPVYGNWCGPGYGSGTPIDILDKGCKNHDMCYRRVGYHKCSCDRTFLRYVKNNYKKMAGTSQKAMAKVIQGWLTIKTSNVTSNGGNFSCRK